MFLIVICTFSLISGLIKKKTVRQQDGAIFPRILDGGRFFSSLNRIVLAFERQRQKKGDEY